jgi:hypothetical protein
MTGGGASMSPAAVAQGFSAAHQAPPGAGDLGASYGAYAYESAPVPVSSF